MLDVRDFPTPERQIRFSNARVTQLLSIYLNMTPQAITLDMLNELASTCNIPRERAYAECLAALCGVGTDPTDRAFTTNYFVPMVHELDPSVFEQDLYYRTVRIPNRKWDRWEIRTMQLAPCEAFVCNDFRVYPDGRLVPQIGYFLRTYSYPAVLEDGREWMTLLPNETVTTRPAIGQASGKVLTYGLGLGYFAFMAAQKPEVASVTVIEKSQAVIDLFYSLLLPQFPHREKIRVLCADAFAYAGQTAPQEGYDFIFADIWHDVGDGRDAYLRFKALEPLYSGTRFAYWLEDSIRCYLAKQLWPQIKKPS